MNEPIALVTGSSRGIGEAIARQLRERGMRVIGHATREVDHGTIASDLVVPGAASQLWQEALKRADGIRRLLDGISPGWESDLRQARERHLCQVAGGADARKTEIC